MADLANNIDIGISSKNAKLGASKIRAALDSIKRKSRQLAISADKDAKKMSKGYGRIAKAALALAAVFAAKGIIKRTVDFGQAISDLSAITGAVGKDLDFLRQKSLEFGETTTLTATQAAEAFRIIASAKPDLLENVDALAAVTEEAIALAEATGDTLPVAANTMASALNQFGEGAESASRFINVLAAGSKRGAATVSEMGEALKFSGIIASQAGLSFEETNAALQLMSTRALKGGEAGTQFRGVLLSLTAQSRDELKPEIVGLEKALENLAKSGLDDGSEALDLFGRRNLAAAKTLIQNRGALLKLTGQLTGSTVAYEQQAIRVDNLSGDLKTLRSAYEGVELTIGGELNGALRAMTQAATENLRALSKNPLLKKGVKDTLDLIHRVLEDIGLAWDQITSAVDENVIGIDVWQGAWAGAIDNIIETTKFLWRNFVVGGPANLKLGITLMIAAFDRFRIFLAEKSDLLTVGMAGSFRVFGINVVEILSKVGPAVELIFTKMGQAIGRVFDNIRVTIGKAIDFLITSVANKIASVAKVLDSLGLDETAGEVRNMADAVQLLATAEATATAALDDNNRVREAELQVIRDTLTAIETAASEERKIATDTADAMILEIIATADVQREASRDAVAGAIATRDATLLEIEALRTKRKEIIDGAAAAAENEKLELGPDLSGSATDDTTAAFEKLGDTSKRVVDGIADGFADMAAGGKASFADMTKSIIQDLIRIAIQAQITKALSAFIGSFGSGGSAKVPGASAGATIPVAAHGLDFLVGGGGGTDSKLVQFMATPGETVEVKTPQQQKKGSGNGSITIVQHNIIHAEGADEARIMARMPALLERNKTETLAAVIDLRDKGVLR